MAKPIQFNPYQQAVVNFRQGYAVCCAAPGSGKTAVITARIKALLASDVDPTEILALTFTKEGAKEMTERVGYKGDHKLVSTFHSWALHFIKKEFRSLPFRVHTDDHGQADPLCLPLTQARMMAQICRRLPEKIDWKDAASFVSLMKRRGVTPEQAWREIENDKQELYAMAYDKYEHALREKGLLDFDSIVIETVTLLERREDVRNRWQYRFVQVDEAQDTDSMQWRVVRQLARRHGNVLAVGDENQGMYSWRGSESNLTAYFCSTFPDAKVFPLPINYRSTAAIVEYCKGIAPIQNETVTALSTPNEKGVAPTFLLFQNEWEEAKQVINSITDMGNTAILARMNRQLAAFESECGERGLRYKLLGKSGFWGRPEVKDTIAAVGAVIMPSDANVTGLLRARCEATKFLVKHDTHEKTSAITHLKNYQGQLPNADNGKPQLLHKLLTRISTGDGQEETLRHIGHTLHSLRGETAVLKGDAALHRVIDRFGLLSVYDADDDDGAIDNDPRENILKLVDYASKKGSLSGFFDYTERVRKAHLARTNCLTLSTIHQSKGKEWNTVFVAGVNEEVLPHIKGEPTEERRIYFVACSRAAKKLQVSSSGVPSVLIKGRVKENAAAALDMWSGWGLQS